MMPYLIRMLIIAFSCIATSSASADEWDVFDRKEHRAQKSVVADHPRQQADVESHGTAAADRNEKSQAGPDHGQCLDLIAAVYVGSKASTTLSDAVAARDAARAACTSDEEKELFSEAEQKIDRFITQKRHALAQDQRRQELFEAKRREDARRHGDCGTMSVPSFIYGAKLGSVDERKMVGCIMDGTFFQVNHATRDGWLMVSMGGNEPMAAIRSSRAYMNGSFLRNVKLKYLGLVRFMLVNGGMEALPAFQPMGK